MKEALDALVKFRAEIAILPSNEFMFANTKLSYIRENDALSKCISRCDLKKSELIKSTKLRKYAATVAQVMYLDQENWSSCPTILDTPLMCITIIID